MSFKLALIIDQLEEKYMGKWNHNWKISDSENLNLLLWTCSENEFYFHKTHAGDEFGESVSLSVIEQWLNIRTSERFPNLTGLTKLSPKPRINAHWGAAPKTMSIFICKWKLRGWVSLRWAAGEGNSTFTPWDSFRKGRTSQLFLAVPPSGTPEPGVTQSWALTVPGAG